LKLLFDENLSSRLVGATAGIEIFIRAALVKVRTFEISPEESVLVLFVNWSGREDSNFRPLAPHAVLN
jgi:hypothetical protein